MHLLRSTALTVTTLASLGLAGTVHADTFYNDLDADVDAVLETMNLTYDSITMTGSSGSTLLRLREDDAPDHPNCNIQGGSHWVKVTGSSSDTGVAVLTTGPEFTFDTCLDELTVGVVATGVGSSTISFDVTDQNTSNDPSLGWSTVEADFLVNVTEGGGGSTGCDADPAAPAWAAAILKASGFKPGAKQTTNLISQIAQEMTQGADFAGFQKSEHPEYEDAVQARLQEISGKTLVSAQAAARPGWVCAPIS